MYDGKAAYTRSTGDLIWRKPDQGRIIARIVSALGDGNDHPFRADHDNVLYFQLMFAGVMKSAVTGDTFFRVTLPPGYDVKEVGPCPTTLSIFGNTYPQGRGTPVPSWQI